MAWRENETVVRATSERINMGRVQETVPRALAGDLDVVIGEVEGRWLRRVAWVGGRPAYRVRAAATKTATKMAKSASIAGVADGSAICGHFRIA